MVTTEEGKRLRRLAFGTGGFWRRLDMWVLSGHPVCFGQDALISGGAIDAPDWLPSGASCAWDGIGEYVAREREPSADER